MRKLCLALPEAHEVEAWEAPTFRVKNKLFAMYADIDNSHDAGHESVWIKATKTNQMLMIDEDPERFFSPPYVGPSGWIGVRLGRGVDWHEVDELLRDAYRMTAPAKLIAMLDTAAEKKTARRRLPGAAPSRPKAKSGTRRDRRR